MLLPVLLAMSVLLLIWLSNVADSRPRCFGLVRSFWLGINTLVALIGTGLLISPLSSTPVEVLEVHPGVALSLLGASAAAGLLLSESVRTRLARLVPLKTDSSVHLTALMLSCHLVGWSLASLYSVGGVAGMQATAEAVPLEYVALQAAGLTVVAFAGVGLATRRSWSSACARLGLIGVPAMSWIALIVAVVGLLGINFVGSVIWVIVAPDQAESIGAISDVLLGDYDSLLLVFLLSVLSSVSEEILFRGALQPVLGIVPTAILFGATHLQYAISPATLIVFLIGVVLGVLRRHFGTWAAVMAHFGYNFSLLILGMIASRLVELVG